MIPSNCAWRVVVSMRSSKESSRFFSDVEAVALPNLPQTFGGRERSKRGYAASPLCVDHHTTYVLTLPPLSILSVCFETFIGTSRLPSTVRTSGYVYKYMYHFYGTRLSPEMADS